MAKLNINKKQFIECYSYLYGTTKKEAAAVYKTVNNEYRKAVIDSFRRDVKSAFYND